MSEKFDDNLYDVVMFDGREERVTGPFRGAKEAVKHSKFLMGIEEYAGMSTWIEMRG